ncbi:hypothetical protein SNK03_007327 [Fusarium graminearum]|uniref:Chromosome 2, complete genome n=2 Tax=Gibberella zeae TaxID=5518 RepID=I1RKQ6_GIBZE|nr:hypothetical protein FGSG_04471 [Fusarium graminearum PH-1]EYB24988.1 hypothetical protein FG05_04471 [Fusarium graminearum]ESU08627.1 hypothetical protein FGSG_04471 [Fusarium graminearum PH-1]KAI6773302.1 hypothetical protein HG531_000151 [Fusarium graminearum]PCD28369.1 hypothetical protein FGRA07_03508 [Fusarium graminearum]CAF3517784.1 unnamed protein product [Fusarium graminearum]|eukprot:XP_011321126.1 hypothetical protein FGSG_04471 [Fusarium graminearum PH-1]
MFTKFTTIVAAAAALVSANPLPRGESGSCSVTPHDMYSSSIGVLGCKINTNRVAYWPGSVDCNNICVKVSNEGRSVYLLKIDSSGGAHDISYDAWNYLGFGKSATQDPQMGGGINMDYEYVHASKCKDLLDDGKLPLAAANSMNYVASCLSEPKSWVAQNYELYNINDPVCKHGVDEKCHLNLAVSNQPECPSGLGSVKGLKLKVENIMYGTGEKAVAL